MRRKSTSSTTTSKTKKETKISFLAWSRSGPTFCYERKRQQTNCERLGLGCWSMARSALWDSVRTEFSCAWQAWKTWVGR
jgi:hypothetical protein